MTREPVDLARCYRLLNHGPTVLVSAAHGGRRNVMAAAWNMPLDFSPPKVAVVIDGNTFTRPLVEGSGQFVLNVPSRAQAALATAVGTTSGREIDKFAALQIATSPASQVAAPLIDGCIAWLECRLLPEPAIQKKYDLFLAEVVAAWADPRAYTQGRWVFEDDGLRTLHHIAGGHYFIAGEQISS